MKRRKKVAFLNAVLFGLFTIAFLMKFQLLSIIFLILFAAVFVFTVQS